MTTEAVVGIFGRRQYSSDSSLHRPCRGKAVNLIGRSPAMTSGTHPHQHSLYTREVRDGECGPSRQAQIEMGVGIRWGSAGASQLALSGAIYLGSEMATSTRGSGKPVRCAGNMRPRQGAHRHRCSPWRAMDRREPCSISAIVGMSSVEGVTGKLVARPYRFSSQHDAERGSALSGTHVCPVSSWKKGWRAHVRLLYVRGVVMRLCALTGIRGWRRDNLVGAAFASSSPPAPNVRSSGIAIWIHRRSMRARRFIHRDGRQYSSPTTRLSVSIWLWTLKSGDIRWSYQATEKRRVDAAASWRRDGMPEGNGPDSVSGAATYCDRAGWSSVWFSRGPKRVGIRDRSGSRYPGWKTKVGPRRHLAGITSEWHITDRLRSHHDADDGRQHVDAARPGLYGSCALPASICGNPDGEAPVRTAAPCCRRIAAPVDGDG